MCVHAALRLLEDYAVVGFVPKFSRHRLPPGAVLEGARDRWHEGQMHMVFSIAALVCL